MDYFIIFGLLGFGGMIIGFIGYKVVTGNIIKELERENEILKTDNERLRTALRTKTPARQLFISSVPFNENGALDRIIREHEAATKTGGLFASTNYFKEF